MENRRWKPWLREPSSINPQRLLHPGCCRFACEVVFVYCNFLEKGIPWLVIIPNCLIISNQSSPVLPSIQPCTITYKPLSTISSTMAITEPPLANHEP